MGRRGPIGDLKLPTHLRVVPNDAPVDSAAAKVRPAAPSKPAGQPAEVSRLWDEIVPVLDDAGLLAEVDGLTLDLALRHYAAAVKASNMLQRAAVAVHDGAHDRLAKHPASQVFRDHSTAFLEFAKQLGLTFAARARTPGSAEPSDKPANPFANPENGK